MLNILSGTNKVVPLFYYLWRNTNKMADLLPTNIAEIAVAEELARTAIKMNVISVLCNPLVQPSEIDKCIDDLNYLKDVLFKIQYKEQ